MGMPEGRQLVIYQASAFYQLPTHILLANEIGDGNRVAKN